MVIIEKRKEDYILGSSPVEHKVLNESGDWQSFSPEHEHQFNFDNLYDTSMCVSFSATDSIEYLFNKAIYDNRISLEDLRWLRTPTINGKTYPSYYKNGKINFSERFVGALGDTTIYGAYQYKVGDAIRKYGLIPQDMFPLANSFEKNIDKDEITQEMYDLGKEFIERFPINYEWVDDTEEALKYGPLQVIVYYADGDHILCPKQTPNHAIVLINYTDRYSLIDDSYKRQFKKYCHEAIHSPMLYTVNFKKTMTFKKQKDLPAIYFINEVRKTKTMVVDMETLEAFQGEFEEVDSLEEYADDGTFVWVNRIIK
jgi:hypothetical protein